MNHARIWARVKIDTTGNTVRLPVILFLIDGKITVLEPFLRYLIRRHHERSHSWMTKLCEIIGQLLDYIEANSELTKPVRLFEGFINALYNGTFDENNQDQSNLCWFPSSVSTVNPKLYMLEEFSDWMVKEGYVPESLNPWTIATATEQKINWLAWYRRNEYSFLGHLGLSEKTSSEVQKARAFKLRRQPIGKTSSAKAFPANFEAALLRNGFIRHGKDDELDILEKFDWRGICIALLLIYGARRLSEPFHLWTGDVMENPTRRGEALVRIYHPVEGQAPEKPKISGRRAQNRQAYLQAFHPRYLPRTHASGNYHAGFKGRALTDDKAKFIQVHWLPSHMAEAFLWAYHNYMQQRARLGLDGMRHPFAFVTHKGEYKGEPYTIKSFEKAWKRAVTRIGLPHAKIHGTTPHGGRHGMGMRANKGGVSQYEAQEVFAHSSPESQRTYRIPSAEQVTKSLEAATRRIRNEDDTGLSVFLDSPTSSNWKEIWQEQEHKASQRLMLNRIKRPKGK